jgi:hypothetical protein
MITVKSLNKKYHIKDRGKAFGIDLVAEIAGDAIQTGGYPYPNERRRFIPTRVPLHETPTVILF